MNASTATSINSEIANNHMVPCIFAHPNSLAKLGILTHTVYANSLFSKGIILQDVRCPRRLRLQLAHHALP